jgi:hypothetical protein
MSLNVDAWFALGDWRGRHNFFCHGYRAFERDLHVVILGTLEAGNSHVERQYKKESRSLKVKLKQAEGHYQEWLESSCAELSEEKWDQQRFFRNMATVAIATRLIQALRKLLGTAERFKARKPCRDKSKSEILRLWTELGDCYGIDISGNAERIAFATSLNDVRNQIVHDGGNANSSLPFAQCNPEGGDAGLLDLRFSTKYPQYVEGSESSAEVNVSMKQVQQFGDDSLKLLNWVADELWNEQLKCRKAEVECPALFIPVDER